MSRIEFQHPWTSFISPLCLLFHTREFHSIQVTILDPKGSLLSQPSASFILSAASITNQHVLLEANLESTLSLSPQTSCKPRHHWLLLRSGPTPPPYLSPHFFTHNPETAQIRAHAYDSPAHAFLGSIVLEVKLEILRVTYTVPLCVWPLMTSLIDCHPPTYKLSPFTAELCVLLCDLTLLPCPDHTVSPQPGPFAHLLRNPS